MLEPIDPIPGPCLVPGPVPMQCEYTNMVCSYCPTPRLILRPTQMGSIELCAGFHNVQ